MTSYDLQINQGENYSLSIQVNDNAGNPIDLSNSIVSGMIKFRYGDTGISGVLQDLNATVQVPGTSGIVNLSILDINTAQMPIGVAVYTVKSYDTGLLRTTWLLNGNAFINPEATFLSS